MNLKSIVIEAANAFIRGNPIKNSLLKPEILRKLEVVIEDACIKAQAHKEVELAVAVALRQQRDKTVADLTDLIHHMWIHSNYLSGGYDYMTSDQKKVYDEAVSRYKAEQQMLEAATV